MRITPEVIAGFIAALWIGVQSMVWLMECGSGMTLYEALAVIGATSAGGAVGWILGRLASR